MGFREWKLRLENVTDFNSYRCLENLLLFHVRESKRLAFKGLCLGNVETLSMI